MIQMVQIFPDLLSHLERDGLDDGGRRLDAPVAHAPPRVQVVRHLEAPGDLELEGLEVLDLERHVAERGEVLGEERRKGLPPHVFGSRERLDRHPARDDLEPDAVERQVLDNGEHITLHNRTLAMEIDESKKGDSTH